MVKYDLAYNGMGGNGKLLNTHISYKGRSVIIDYEFCLHPYDHLKRIGIRLSPLRYSLMAVTYMWDMWRLIMGFTKPT